MSHLVSFASKTLEKTVLKNQLFLLSQSSDARDKQEDAISKKQGNHRSTKSSDWLCSCSNRLNKQCSAGACDVLTVDWFLCGM